MFVVLYGAGNGLLTIARGTVPLALFGPLGYGERTGLLGAPARAAQAFAPLLFGLLWTPWACRPCLSRPASVSLHSLRSSAYEPNRLHEWAFLAGARRYDVERANHHRKCVGPAAAPLEQTLSASRIVFPVNPPRPTMQATPASGQKLKSSPLPFAVCLSPVIGR